MGTEENDDADYEEAEGEGKEDESEEKGSEEDEEEPPNNSKSLLNVFCSTHISTKREEKEEANLIWNW
jgi:hypothetical protein